MMILISIFWHYHCAGIIPEFTRLIISFKLFIVEVSKECSPKSDEEKYGNSFGAINDSKPV